MNRFCLLSGSIFGALAVILGAFAAHGLEKLISLDAQQTFETGVRYQMYHALFLLLIGQMGGLSKKVKRQMSVLVIIGTMMFSGSIYLLATNALTNFDFRAIGFVTPIGGSLLIVAWIILGIRIFKMKA